MKFNRIAKAFSVMLMAMLAVMMISCSSDPVNITGISIDTTGVDTSVTMSEAADYKTDNLKVYSVYSDGTRELLTNGYTVNVSAVTGATSEGTYTVIVNADGATVITGVTGLSTSYTVTVTADTFTVDTTNVPASASVQASGLKSWFADYITVKDTAGKTLTYETDYTLSYTENNDGTITFRVTATANNTYIDKTVSGIKILYVSSWYKDGLANNYNFEISQAKELFELAQIVNGKITTTEDGTAVDTTNRSFSGWTVNLTADIDLSDYEAWTPIGTYDTTTHTAIPFSGTFSGKKGESDSYTITGLTVNSSDSYIGLFGYATDASIEYLTIDGASVTGSSYVGALVGRIYFDVTIQNITVSNSSIKGTDKYSSVGGIIGYSYGNISILTCNNYRTSVSGDNYVGGIIGYIESSSTSSSINNCIVTLDSSSYAVSGNSDVGGILGRSQGNSSMTNNTVIFTGSNITGADSNTQKIFIGGVGSGRFTNNGGNRYSTDGTSTNLQDWSY